MSRALLLMLAVVSGLLGGCGVPFDIVKPTASSGFVADQVTVTATSANAFSALLSRPAAALSTGEQSAAPPTSALPAPRGVAALTELGESLSLTLSTGTGIRVVASGPERADLAVTIELSGEATRIDGDPLSPRREVESFVVSTDRPLTFTVQAEDLSDPGRMGYVRWYAFLLPSSRGEVTCRHESAGPAGSLVVPDSFSFDAMPRGERLEVMLIGPAGSDLVAEVTVGDRRFEVDEDPQEPLRRIEAFNLRIDDPARVTVQIEDYTGDSLAGSVYWAVLRLPSIGLRELEAGEQPAGVSSKHR